MNKPFKMSGWPGYQSPTRYIEDIKPSTSSYEQKKKPWDVYPESSRFIGPREEGSYDPNVRTDPLSLEIADISELETSKKKKGIKGFMSEVMKNPLGQQVVTSLASNLITTAFTPKKKDKPTHMISDKWKSIV